MAKKYIVRLTAEERSQLSQVIKKLKGRPFLLIVLNLDFGLFRSHVMKSANNLFAKRKCKLL